MVVWDPFHELERPSATGVVVRVRSPFLCVGWGNDRCRRHGKAGKHRGVRVVKGDPDSVLAECLYFFDICEEVFPIIPVPIRVVRVALVELAVEGKDDRGCVERGAVVEGDVVPKEEGKNSATLGDAPGDGEARLDQGGAWLVGDEPFEDAIGTCEGFLVGGVCGVELVRVACAAEDEGVCMSGERVRLRGWKRSGLDGGCVKRDGSSE